LKPPSADQSWTSIEYRFDPRHPTAAGHFPDNPIIPGALLLDHVLRALGGAAPMHLPLEVQMVKFLRPVRPGDRVDIRWRRQDAATLAFECRIQGGNEVALTGSARAAVS
jgi:3-hydroxymyristoyl/3-hydroxydecanoyl-(acyl carrier protein) dehydratase